MVIVNSREFRANQGKYLGMAAQGNGVILRSRSYGSFKITPLTEDDTLMTKEEFLRKVDEGIRQIEEGKGTVVRSKEELDAFFKSL
ncbi:MAG: prevent-host-death protein [Bacteroidales bacterium]|nr:prevent-host-death protein [Bacteroidales bacterium]